MHINYIPSYLKKSNKNRRKSGDGGIIYIEVYMSISVEIQFWFSFIILPEIIDNNARSFVAQEIELEKKQASKLFINQNCGIL